MQSQLISSPAPARRGRPRIHVDGAACARAYRRRCKTQKLRNLGMTREKAAAEWNSHSPSEQAFIEESVALSQRIQNAHLNNDVDEVIRFTGMLQYVEQVERQRIREAKLAAKLPKSWEEFSESQRASIENLLDDPNKGVFLHDAPSGDGLLVSGSVDVERIDARRQNHTGRVGCPPSSDDAEWNDWETEYTYIDRQKFPLEWETSEEQEALRRSEVTINKPTCFQCGGPASLIHPDDQNKRVFEARFVCDRHKESMEELKTVLPISHEGTPREVTPCSGGIRIHSARPHAWGKNKGAFVI
jgi:hypothetical protein